jgi:radical SAM protein with 4Fe4S-binding SPASM domain
MIGPQFVFEVTPRCNLQCRYCYNVWKSGAGKAPEELSLDRIEILSEAIYKAHPVSVTLTGGEPLMREDISAIAGIFQRRGILVGIATNGLLLDRAAADALVHAGISWFEVSLPSSSENGYSELTGFSGFEASKRAMLAARSSGAKLTVSHIITSGNVNETASVIDLAYAFCAEAFALNRFVPGGAGLEAINLQPDIEQLDSALRIASESSKRSPGMLVYAAIPVENCLLKHTDYPGIDFGSCVCGSGKWAIGPSGTLRVCEQSPHELGSLLDRSFEELTGSDYCKEFRNRNRSTDCTFCDSFDKCGGGCRFLQTVSIS